VRFILVISLVTGLAKIHISSAAVNLSSCRQVLGKVLSIYSEIDVYM